MLSQVVAFLLVMPLVIFSYELTGVPLSDLVCLMGVYFFLRNIFLPQALFFLAALMLALLSVIIGIIRYDTAPIMAIGSMLFLFKPGFAYFVGYSLIKNYEDAKLFFKSFSWVTVMLVTAVLFSLLVNYGMVVRSESSLNGDILGLPLFGAYGVNSLAAFYVILALGLMFNIFYIKAPSRSMFVFAFVVLVVLVLLSLSRMAILGLIVMFLGLIIHLSRENLRRGIGLAFLAFLLTAVACYWAYQTGLLDAKINQIVQGLENADINYLSSYRFALYAAAVGQVIDSPFWGTAFGGYTVTLAAIDGFDYLSGLSPHNQYITLFWKMGFPAAVSYLLFLGAAVYFSFRQKDKNVRAWSILLTSIMLLVFCNVWDALLIPNVSAIYYFFLGGLAHEWRRKT